MPKLLSNKINLSLISTVLLIKTKILVSASTATIET